MAREPDAVLDRRRTLVVSAAAVVQHLCDTGQWDNAEQIVRQMLPVHPAPITYRILGRILLYLGRSEEAIACLHLALQLDPNLRAAHDDLIMLMDLDPTISHAEAQAERHRWWLQFGRPLYRRPRPVYTQTRDTERPLRIGYVSGDFRFHSAFIALQRLLLEPCDGHTAYYYSSALPAMHDAITETIKATHPETWRDVHVLNDHELAARIRADQIDILVDLSGYTPCNRLPAFCLKPAPIQVTAWGYATGVGWPAMDGLFADPVSIPAALRSEYVERIVDLPAIIPVEGDETLPEAGALPCLSGAPTFAVFQRPAKINAGALALWRAVLVELPESRLAIKGPHYTDQMKTWILSQMGEQARQVEFWPAEPRNIHLCAYQQIDLSLDPFPQHGGVSSGESLWMGVPVVTLLGERIPQRVSASLLSAVGLDEFIATTPETYVQEAVAWVTDRRERLADIRHGLRDRMRASRLCAGYREAVAQTYRELWKEWCQDGRITH